MSSQVTKPFFIPPTAYNFKPGTHACECASQARNNLTIFSDPAFQSAGNFLNPNTANTDNTLTESSQTDGQLSMPNSCAALPQDYGLHNNMAIYASSLVTTGNVELHDSSASSNLNFATSNQFYTVNGKLQNSFDDVHQMDYVTNPMSAQMCSFDAALQTYITNAQVHDGSQPGLYNSMDCTYRTVATGEDNHSSYNLNSGAYQDGTTGRFPAQYCVVPDGRFVMSKLNSVHENTSDYRKPFQQFIDCSRVSLPSSNSMEEAQLTGGVGMVNICVDVGIQCEVGPETLQALRDEEEEEEEGEEGEEREGEGGREEGLDAGDSNDQSQPKDGMMRVCEYYYAHLTWSWAIPSSVLCEYSLVYFIIL